ncbi:hypothetical protein CcCBS67573_g05347 [Chytriomyces confervae]|uniref:DUF885 domain-containing protein n=1 Tax=Chytriomyces confervae TaxID=246404 RepID=A0A507FAT5_9FUNG|nr:hypothetical protein HDU80_004280 [Chytriomyces hyalinus]TPX73383.1 hypothetical protein CcCBS67573_g05347 [Chytriomyces confervae]
MTNVPAILHTEKKVVVTTTTATVDGNSSTTTKTTTTTTKTFTPVSNLEAISKLNDKYVDIIFKEDPFNCAVFGVRKYEDQVFDLSLECMKKSLADRQALLEEVKRFEAGAEGALSVQEAIDLNILKEALEGNIESLGVPGEVGYAFELLHNHMMSPFASLEMLIGNYQRKETKEDLINYNTRLQLLGAQFDHVIASYKSGIRRGITLNKEGAELMIKKFSDGIGGETLEERTEFAAKSPLNMAKEAKELLGDEHYLVPAIRDHILPGYAKVKTFLEQEYLPHVRQSPGLYGMPDYEKQYAAFILQNTNIRYTPTEVHEIGLKEVARIEALMETAKTTCGFEGTLQEFQADLFNKEKYPQLYYEKDEDTIQDYIEICAAAKAKMVDYFDKFPKFDCRVEPVPAFLEMQMPLAFYMQGTPTTAGCFSANMRLHKIKPSHQKTALCLHEANPGHHHQVSLALENDNLHLARRLTFYTSYAEGWGLYCEYLGEEMGFYSDPFQYFGRLELEMFRAIRLVVDSGLHGKGWSVDQAVDYMLSKVSMTRDEIVTEVSRYCVIPGQALSYKIGEFKIKELRAYAEKELGEKFDIKKFHACVIDYGMVPLGTLEQIVKNWVKNTV